MSPTISVSEDTREQLMRIKLEEGKVSVDELLQEMLVEHRKIQFHKASDLFRRRLSDEGVASEDLVE